MAKKSVGVGYFGGNPKTRMSNVLAGDARTGGRAKFNQTSAMYSASPYADRPAPLSTYTPPKEKALAPQSIDIRGYFGDERTGIRKTGVGPSRKAVPTATAAAPKAKKTVGETIRTFVREKLTPTRKTGPQMGLNRVTGNTTGFTSGTTTGKTITKSGVATKTPMSASRRAEQNAFNKGGVAGPSRGGGGGSFRSSGGGGRGMTGGGGMGASGRGTGGKK